MYPEDKAQQFKKVEKVRRDTHCSLRSTSRHFMIAKVDAEIPIKQKSLPFSHDNDIPLTDITMKNMVIKVSTVMHCNNQSKAKK